MTDTIRLATPDELPAVEAIVDRAYGHYVERIGRKPGPMVDDYAALIKNRCVHVFERDKDICGILVLTPLDDAMLLDNVAVDPRFQGTGVGRELIIFAEKTAEAAKYKTMRLYTNEKMTENIALYGRIGFAETNRITEKGLNRVYMEKQLS
jgi:ribosomal protein S18 acetylase RimI-like enzyme